MARMASASSPVGVDFISDARAAAFMSLAMSLSFSAATASSSSYEEDTRGICSSVERPPASSVGVAMARLGGGWRRARRRGATPGAARRARRGRSALVHPSAGTAGARDARDARTTTARRDVNAPTLDPRAIAAAAAAGARHGAAVIMAIRFAPAKRRLQIIKSGARPSPRLERYATPRSTRATLPPSGCPTRAFVPRADSLLHHAVCARARSQQEPPEGRFHPQKDVAATRRLTADEKSPASKRPRL